MSKDLSATTAPNAYRLLWAGFMAILASGVGFSIRTGILEQWSVQFGFTSTELGGITGGGLTGFGIVIILSSLVADTIGYGKLMTAAFLLHLISGVITLATPAAFASGGKSAAYECLFWGMFLFSVGNGLCEAVVNPLTATLFPNNRTHYLNILHAGWPAGLVLGGLASAFMAAKTGDGGVVLSPAVDWKIQWCLFLIPVVGYGLMLLGQRFPKSEAATAGVSMAEMISTIFAPLMLVLILIHALVGYVELGTDSWIPKITGAILESPSQGLMLFVYTSTLMFVLRFFAGPIVHRISPLGLLFVSGLLGFAGLTLLSTAQTITFCVIAATVYALGKTFLWPTMLAVASERFPKGGAVAIGMLGGAGMLSAGLLGGPAIGFKQDYYASQKLQDTSKETFDRYKADSENTFLLGLFKANGLDGAKVGVLDDNGKKLKIDGEALAKSGAKDENYQKLADWWATAEKSSKDDKDPVKQANLYGGQMAFRLTAYVPLTMAVLYLLLILYFRTQGGYKAVHISEPH